MSQIDRWSVARVVRRGAALLAESLWEYWPCEGKSEISERNVSLHLGVAFQNAGYRLYAEAHTKGGTDRRIDLLALHPAESTLVVAECKRLYSAEKCTEMVDDLERIREFVPVESNLADHSFGVLAATTWNRALAEWWSAARAVPPSGHGSWKALASELSGSHRGSVVLQGYDEDTELEQHKPHHLLYAIFERK